MDMANRLLIQGQAVKLPVFLEEHVLQNRREVLPSQEIIARHGAHL